MEIQRVQRQTLDDVDKPPVEVDIRLDLERTVIASNREHFDVRHTVLALYQDGVAAEPRTDSFVLRFTVDGHATQIDDGPALGMSEHLSMYLPRAAVGVGAKWTDTAELDAGLIVIESVRTSELVAFDGGVATIEMRSELTRESQQLDMPTLPPGKTAWLHGMDVTGSTRLEVDMNAIPPRSMMGRTRIKSSGELRDGPVVENTFESSLEAVFAVKPLQSGP